MPCFGQKECPTGLEPPPQGQEHSNKINNKKRYVVSMSRPGPKNLEGMKLKNLYVQ